MLPNCATHINENCNYAMRDQYHYGNFEGLCLHKSSQNKPEIIKQMNKNSMKRQINKGKNPPGNMDKCYYSECQESKWLFVLKKCGRCLAATYCTAKCQADDWKKHKLVCCKKV